MQKRGDERYNNSSNAACVRKHTLNSLDTSLPALDLQHMNRLPLYFFFKSNSDLSLATFSRKAAYSQSTQLTLALATRRVQIASWKFLFTNSQAAKSHTHNQTQRAESKLWHLVTAGYLLHFIPFLHCTAQQCVECGIRLILACGRAAE